MPANAKLSPEQLEKLKAEYLGRNPYDPNEETVEELAARYGITASALYWHRSRQRWGRNGVEPPGEDGSTTIKYLADQLAAANRRVQELEAENAFLRAQLDA